MIIRDRNKQIHVLVSGVSPKINQVKIPKINVAIPNPIGLTYQ
jgi:hypothetical protein